jgi:AcrR family transcriptional regulator
MRYEKGHSSATKQRIVDVAAQRFRESGVAAVGLTGVMAEAGLTNGAFYGHFDSKEALVREALVHALEARESDFVAIGPAGGSLEDGLRAYLSAAHRDNPGIGCPSAALLPEIGRQGQATRQAYTERLVRFIDLVADLLPAGDPARTRATATAIFGMAIGTLQLARAVADRRLSDDILESGVQSALTLARGLAGTT